MPRYVLAYSGGLDTSVMLKWLQERHGAEVFTFTADLGHFPGPRGGGAKADIAQLRKKALSCGAAGVFIDDLREEFVADYVWPALKAGALYQGAYPLATALGRPLIAKRMVEVAREVGADAVVHGCTGKGNDQVRLEVSVAALAPDLRCIAPIREWELKGREEEVAWAKARGIPVGATVDCLYSIDENLWGVAVEAGALEDPWSSPSDDCWRATVHPKDAPSEPQEIVVSFVRGTPVEVDGVRYEGPELIERLNLIGGAHGVGRLDIVEDRLVGIKSREVYEAPAAVLLHAAREALEQLTLDRETRRVKQLLGQELARIIYDGLWFTPLRESIQAFVEEAMKPVTGEVRMTLYRGQAVASGRKSPNSLYAPSLATYGSGDTFNHRASSGFIEIFGLAARTVNAVRRRSSREPQGSNDSKSPNEPDPDPVPIPPELAASSKGGRRS